MSKPHWDSARENWRDDNDDYVDHEQPFTDAYGITWVYEPIDDNGYYAWVPTRREEKIQPKCDCGGYTVGTHSHWCSLLEGKHG